VRIPALSPVIAGGALPRKLALSPVFPDPLCWDLVALDPRYLIPGIETLGENRVALLEVDKNTVAAILAGANHEMARELVWREFPTSSSNTFFRRFWDTGAGGREDIGPISGWTKPILDQNLTGAGADALAAMLVRGDLIMRYPDVHVYVCKGAWKDGSVSPDPLDVREVVLQGALDSRSNFYGFALSPSALRGNRQAANRTRESAGWFVAFEQASTGPRFGLDAAADNGADLTSAPADWKDLSWGHLVAKNASIERMTHAAANAPLPRAPTSPTGKLTWGRNASHMAAITWQKPFRLYVHADRLLDGQ
jgi:hypothetical protein